jgi:hypothetical protein
VKRIVAVAGPVLFVCAIAAHLLIGVQAMVRVVGVGCMVGGVHALVTRTVPVGWEGPPPSTQMRGAGAIVFGLVLLGVGAGMVLFAGVASCVLGWAPEC